MTRREIGSASRAQSSSDHASRRRKELDEFSGGHGAHRLNVRFSLAGEALVPDEVTSMTGLRPDETWNVGQPWRSGRVVDKAVWVLGSGRAPGEEFHVHMDALIERMRPAWHILGELSRQFDGAFEVAIHCAEAQGPLIVALPDVAQAVADLGATIEFDIYCVGDLDVEPPKAR